MRARLSWMRHLLVVPVLLTLAAVSSAGEVRYIYDDLNRLVGVIDATGASAQYTYDAVGNITAITRRTATQVGILALSPTSGPVGATVTIFGTGFSPTPSQNTVTFAASKGKRPTATVTAATANQLTTSVPSGAATGAIIITTPNGTATSGTFTVTAAIGAPTITSFTPTIVTAGYGFTVTGTNFDPTTANDKLKINRSFAQVNTATATSLGATVPGSVAAWMPWSVGSGRLTLTTLAGTTVSTNDLFVPPYPYTAANVQVTGRVTVGGAGKAVNLTTAEKIGLVVFDGTAGQRVALNCSSVTLASTVVRLYDPFAAAVTSTTIGPSGGALGVGLPMDGTYTILVDPDGTNTGSLTVSVSELADVTGTITIDGPAVPVTTTILGQRARITFPGTTGQRLSLGLTAGTFYTGTVSILSSDGTTLASTGLSTTGSLDAPPLPTTGTYTILIDPGGPYAGSVTLTLSTELAGTLTIGGAALPVSLTRPSQNARLTFAGTAGQFVSLALTGVTITQSDVSILNPDGTSLVAPTYITTSGGVLDTPVLPATGAYTILVNPRATYTGNLTLTLSADLTSTITLDGPAVPLSITRAGQRSRMTFPGTAGQWVSLGLTTVTIASSAVSILNPDGTTLASATVGTSGGDIDTTPLPSTGNYTVLIDPAGTNTGDMTLTLSTPVTGTLNPTDPPTQLTLRSGQDARLTFSGNATDWVSVGLSSISASLAPDPYTDYLSLAILKPDGTTLGSVGIRNAGGDLDAQLPVAGPYTVLIKSIQGRAGTLTVTLSTAVVGGLVVNGTPAPVSLVRPGQDGRLTFDGATGQQVTVRVTGNTAGCTNVTLLKPDGTSATNTSSCASSFNLATQALPTTGTYTVSTDPGVNTGNVTLSVTSP